MRCPVCPDTTLNMTHRDGVEIDYCPQCRGVWLDRGELDKILERAARPPASAPSPALEPRAPVAPPPAHRHQDSSAYYKNPQHGGYPPRRKSWLSDLFD